MFDYLAALFDKPRGFADNDRIWRLQTRRAVLDGTIYDKLTYHFHDERDEQKKYIPLKLRRPSVRFNMCRSVVEDSVALVFSEGMFPVVYHDDLNTRKNFLALIKDSNLPDVMADAAIRGSVGSAAVYLRVLKGRVFWTVFDTDYLTPVYDPEEPDALIRVTEKYKIKGRDLKATGYAIADDDLGADFWFQRIFDTEDELWYRPWKVANDDTVTPTIDEARSHHHGFGFCPWVWIKNLPGGAGVDGACTFLAAVHTQIELEYQMSQAGRGLKYSADPTLMLKEPALADGEMVRAPNTALIVGTEGDAKLLEISGSAAAAVVEYCKTLREQALESIKGSRANADKVTAPQSGRAQELMYQPLIWLADKLRATFGQAGLLELMRMLIKASEKFPLRTRDVEIGALKAGPISLVWPQWFPPTSADLQLQAQTLVQLTTGGIMSRETATDKIAPDYDIENTPDEVTKVLAQQAADDARAKALAAQTKATETLTA